MFPEPTRRVIPAWSPITTFPLPVLCVAANAPRTVFWTPTVFPASALLPTAVFSKPVVLAASALLPRAALSSPVVLCCSA